MPPVSSAPSPRAALSILAAAGAALVLSLTSSASPESRPDVLAEVPTHLISITHDPRLQLTMHAPVVVMGDGGWQPFLFATSRGTLFCQSEINEKPFPSNGRKVYPVRIASVLSRDGGATWSKWTHEANHNDVDIEGGATEQRSGGTVLLLDTFVVPSGVVDHGVGELWKSHDDLRTVEGPFKMDFYLPHITWNASTDDVGRPYDAARLHRSLIEMPDGDLLSTMYATFAGDTAPSAYMPTMMKARTVIVRSRDHGAHWTYLSTVAADGGVGTEGFDEPVLVRIPKGVHAGRLLCMMRTGRELYSSHSDDQGLTWSQARPVRIPGVDIYDTDPWVRLFTDPKAPDYVPSDQMIGAIVDPDLIAMDDGTLVCTVGVRAPARLFLKNWHSLVNGDYLAFSCDGGDTWTEVDQILSGQPTTQYMGVREIRPGVLYVVYDDSAWSKLGRTMGFHLDVKRGPER